MTHTLIQICDDVGCAATYLCLPSHLVHIMVFMASFRSSCSLVRNSFMDFESSVAAMRFLRGNETDWLVLCYDITDLKGFA